MIINIANEQAKTENVIVMIINDDYDEHLLSLFDTTVKIVLVGRPRSSKNPLWLLKLNYEIWKQHPDVVHSHYEKIAMYLLRIGYKFVYTIHGFTIPPKYLRKNRNLVAISKGIQDDVKERAGINSMVIYNGIRVEDISIKTGTIAYNNDRVFRIVQVSRLFHEVKGQDVLIKAIAKLKKEGYTNISIDFIGEGASEKYLRSLVNEINLSKVSFLGTKPVEYIAEHLKDYDMFVQASRHEGFGLTVAEAMAAKVPVVVSDCSGLVEVVDNGRYSKVFRKGEVEDCAKKIEELMKTDSQELRKQVDDAWTFVNENFNVKTTARKYIDYYKSI